MRDNSAPAFPVSDAQVVALMGLTKRELFAAMAMQGMLAKDDVSSSEKIASWAVTQADDLLSALAA